MKTLKFLSMLLMMVALSVGFTSCSEDEPNPETVQQYYIVYDVTGGGLSAPQQDDIELQLKELFYDYSYLGPYTFNYAEYDFKQTVKLVESAFFEGLDFVSGTMTIIMSLKDEKEKTVKTGYVYVTKDGSSSKV